jgi:hypothetical protein
MEQNLKIKDCNDENWVTYLFERLIDEAISHDTHFRVPENIICEFSSPYVYVSKPTLEDIDNINMDLVLEKLKPCLQETLKKIKKDLYM